MKTIKKKSKLIIICSIACFSISTVSAQSYSKNYYKYRNKTKTYTTVGKIANGRCFAATAAGNNCSRKATSGSSYCTQHRRKKANDNGYVYYNNTCLATAKSTGRRCRNKVKNHRMYCGSHD